MHELLEKIRLFIKEHLALELKEKVVRIAPVSEGVEFLGFRTYRGLIRIRRKNLVRSRRKMEKKQKDQPVHPKNTKEVSVGAE